MKPGSAWEVRLGKAWRAILYGNLGAFSFSAIAVELGSVGAAYWITVIGGLAIGAYCGWRMEP